jgi:hypothetical protein
MLSSRSCPAEATGSDGMDSGKRVHATNLIQNSGFPGNGVSTHISSGCCACGLHQLLAIFFLPVSFHVAVPMTASDDSNGRPSKPQFNSRSRMGEWPAKGTCTRQKDDLARSNTALCVTERCITLYTEKDRQAAFQCHVIISPEVDKPAQRY